LKTEYEENSEREEEKKKKKNMSSSQFFQIRQVSEDISRQLSDVVHTDVPMETKEKLLVVSG